MQGGGGAPLVPAGMATAAYSSGFDAAQQERTALCNAANQATMCKRVLQGYTTCHDLLNSPYERDSSLLLNSRDRHSAAVTPRVDSRQADPEFGAAQKCLPGPNPGQAHGAVPSP
jgi:hypothetical protein